MGVFASPVWVKTLAWTAAAIILALNGMLAYETISGWLTARPAVGFLVLPFTLAIGALLAWLIAEPWMRRGAKIPTAPAAATPPKIELALDVFAYRRILVPLDHSNLDAETLLHATALARSHKAKIILLHVEEDVTSFLYGEVSSTAEVEHGHQYLESLRSSVEAAGVETELVVAHGGRVSQQIVRTAKSSGADLLVMGAHGHKGLKDMIFGATINEVRHSVGVSVLVVRGRTDR
jgi:manganese transport protein